MRFFAILSLFSAFLLGITIQSGLSKVRPEPHQTPNFLKNYKSQIKQNFKRPENANVLFSFITGDKSGISPHTKKAFKKINLSFLLSPSGIHFSCVLIFLSWFIKKIKINKLRRFVKTGLLFSFIFFPFDSIKRLSILRLIFQIKFLSKLEMSVEKIFVMTFIIAFILGDFKNSSIGFIYSLLFLGTFFSLRNYSKIILIMGLFSTQLILGLFMGEKVSLLSIPIGMAGSLVFTFIFPLLLVFLATFWMIPINWAEPIIRSYIVTVQTFAKILNGSFTSSSFFIIAAVWVLMMNKHSTRKCVAFAILLFLHTNTAMTPAIIH